MKIAADGSETYKKKRWKKKSSESGPQYRKQVASRQICVRTG
jgi:hypothetical protein